MNDVRQECLDEVLDAAKDSGILLESILLTIDEKILEKGEPFNAGTVIDITKLVGTPYNDSAVNILNALKDEHHSYDFEFFIQKSSYAPHPNDQPFRGVYGKIERDKIPEGYVQSPIATTINPDYVEYTNKIVEIRKKVNDAAKSWEISTLYCPGIAQAMHQGRIEAEVKRRVENLETSKPLPNQYYVFVKIVSK